MNEEPTIVFESSDIKEENLQHALVEKFSYGRPTMTKLRKFFPQKLKIVGECNIGSLGSRHIYFNSNDGI